MIQTRIKVGKSAMDKAPMYYPQYLSEGYNIYSALITIIFFSVLIGIQWFYSAGQMTIITTVCIGLFIAVWNYLPNGWCSIYFVSDHSHGIRGFCYPDMRQDNYSMDLYDARRAIDKFLECGHQPEPKDLNIIKYP